MSGGLISQVLNWLRAGYPEGVPPKDYTPLLALLRRTLTDDEFGEVLVAIEQADPDPVRLEHIRDAIRQVTAAAPDEDEVRRIAARLAASGWPLSGDARRASSADDETDADADAEDRGIVTQVLRWLSAGYPDGVPAADRVPILALLRRRLTDDEVHMVADVLVSQAGAGSDLSAVDARVLMTRTLGELPSEDDVERVRAHLGASGWSLV